VNTLEVALLRGEVAEVVQRDPERERIAGGLRDRSGLLQDRD